MNKNELINELTRQTGLTKKAAGEIVAAFAVTIKDALSKGEKVLVPGLGVFDLTERKPFVGTHPKTGQKLAVPALKTVRFRPSENWKKSLR